MSAAIEMYEVTRYYLRTRGVQELNLTIPSGTIFGLLGENGSGKTTAMKLAMGSLLPDTGRVRTLSTDPGEMPPEVRARVGWLSDGLAVPNRFTLYQAMELQAAYFPSWNQNLARDLSARFNLKSQSVFGQLSLGQKRRFMLTLVIAQMPDLLVLDEPAGGLDPSVRRQLIDVLLEQATSRPMTIVLSSHILSDVERLVERVAFMKDGRVVVEDELETLRGSVKRICVSTHTQLGLVQAKFHVRQVEQSGGTWRVVVEDYSANKMEGIDASVEHLNLEELFLVYNEANLQAV